MQVDFYHLTRDPAEKLVPILASKARDTDTRVLIVAKNEDQHAVLSKALWHHHPTSFLAHDLAGSDNETEQPILISDKGDAPNDAKFVIIADGEWRAEALKFERAFFLFLPEQIETARTLWRDLSGNEEVSTRYWKQDGGRWVEGP